MYEGGRLMVGQANLVSPTVAQRPRFNLPGTTASGIASAAQLADATAYLAFRTDTIAAPGRLLVLAPAHPGPQFRAIVPTPINADDFPVLAGIWGNAEDDIFDAL
jgi:hypothetical protein